MLGECLCIVHDKDLRRAADVFECVNDDGDPALLLLIGKGPSVGEVAVRQHCDKQPRTLYLTVRDNPLEVVAGEVHLHALTGGVLGIDVGVRQGRWVAATRSSGDKRRCRCMDV